MRSPGASSARTAPNERREQRAVTAAMRPNPTTGARAANLAVTARNPTARAAPGAAAAAGVAAAAAVAAVSAKARRLPRASTTNEHLATPTSIPNRSTISSTSGRQPQASRPRDPSMKMAARVADDVGAAAVAGAAGRRQASGRSSRAATPRHAASRAVISTTNRCLQGMAARRRCVSRN